MTCKHSENCSYYNTDKDKTTSKQYSLLVESYCEGQLQSICRRKLYENEFCKTAPENMAPNGYLVGTHKKLRTADTRKHKRYQVKSGTCLLKDPYSNNTFSAEVIDVSKGGLKLATRAQPHSSKKELEPTILKILEHTIDEAPFLLQRDLIKIVWRNNQVFGCAFVYSAA